MPEEFTLFHSAVSACIVFAAFVVRGMSGFGAGMFGVPLLAFLMPVHTAVPLFGLLGVAAGVMLFAQLDNRLLLQLLGGFLIGYALYALAVRVFGLPEFTCSQRWAAPVGFTGAAIDTLFGGGGGTLVVIYLHMRKVGRAPFRATVAALWLFEMLARIAGYGAAGYYSWDILLLVLLLLPVMGAGTWLGERLGNRISQEAFSTLLALLLLLAGTSLLLK